MASTRVYTKGVISNTRFSHATRRLGVMVPLEDSSPSAAHAPKRTVKIEQVEDDKKEDGEKNEGQKDE